MHAHRVAGYRTVTLSLKRVGQPPGDVTPSRWSRPRRSPSATLGELRVTHEQNLVLPWVREERSAASGRRHAPPVTRPPNIGLLTDMIACPGGDLCALANARRSRCGSDRRALRRPRRAVRHRRHRRCTSAAASTCGHHHSGHIGILGVDKDGTEWYQVTLGGANGSRIGGPAVPGA